MIRFGPSGTDPQFPLDAGKAATNTAEYVRWLCARGLTAFEINFTRGVRLGAVTARKIGEVARECGITISGHAPYYINLANIEKTAFTKNYNYILSSLLALFAIGAPDDDGRYRLVIHVGSQCDLARDVAIENCRQSLLQVIAKLSAEPKVTFPYLLCIETMGRFKQIGNHTEIIDICALDDCIVPTLDFGHINCIEQGALGTTPERMTEIMDYARAKLGGKMHRPHIHFSAIIYTAKGEHAHTVLGDTRWNFPFAPLAQYFKKHKLEPIVICESKGRQALDASDLVRYN